MWNNVNKQNTHNSLAIVSKTVYIVKQCDLRKITHNSLAIVSKIVYVKECELKKIPIIH